MAEINRRIVLASRPAGAASVENFRLEEIRLVPLQDGEVRIRNRFLSLDPYMRGRMSEGRSYAEAQKLGEVIVSGAAGEVVESRHPKWQAGDRVTGAFGWQEYATTQGHGMARVNDNGLPLSVALGAVGMPGVTAWYGIEKICALKAGETVVVSAAAGAVGSVAGQLAKQKGCRVVGIAGGPDKCRHVIDTRGFDACVDYKAGKLKDDIKAAAPNGIDGYFENVGGEVLETVLVRMSNFGRIALCGLISSYEQERPPPVRNFNMILIARLKVQGFIISDVLDLWPQALGELEALALAKKLVWSETIADGLPSAPAAFLSMLRGGNLGKQLVRL
jgi:NADPH-dependent curcumin reductase CurA